VTKKILLPENETPEQGLVFTTPIGTGLEGTAITKGFHRKLEQARLP